MRGKLPVIALGALGVVFGDIGTSPLYAFRQCFVGVHAPSPSPGNVLGVLSLIFWTLVGVVCVKYATFVLKANHDGEGGTLALLALLYPEDTQKRNRMALPAIALIVLFGTAALYGDGVITPRHLGHLGDRRPQRLDQRRSKSHGPAHDRDPAGPVLDPISRDRTDRVDVRSGHAAVVRCDFRPGLGCDRRASGCASRARSALRAGVRLPRWNDDHGGLGRDRVVRIGRRGTLCGPRALRNRPHSVGMVRRRFSGANPQLLRTRSACA